MISVTDYYPANDGSATTVVVLNTAETFEVPFDQFQKGMKDYNEGALIQNAFPFLNAEQREFMMTGMSFEEQRKFFNQNFLEDDEEDDEPPF